MLAGVDRAYSREQGRISAFGLSNATPESVDRIGVSVLRNSPLVTGISLMGKNPMHAAYKPITQNAASNDSAVALSPSLASTANGAHAQASLLLQDGCLINRVLPKISDSTHDYVSDTASDTQNSSAPKSSSSSIENMLTPVELDRQLKNNLCVQHSRVLRRICPPGSAITVTQNARKSTNIINNKLKPFARDPPAPYDRHHKSAAATTDNNHCLCQFSISDEDLDDVELYEDVTSSMPNSRSSNMSRAKPILQKDITSAGKRPMRRIRLGHAVAATSLQGVSKSSVLPEKISKPSISDSSWRASMEVGTRHYPVSDDVCHTPQSATFSLLSETARCTAGQEAVQSSDTLSPRLSSHTPKNPSLSPQLRLSTGQNCCEESNEQQAMPISSYKLQFFDDYQFPPDNRRSMKDPTMSSALPKGNGDEALDPLAAESFRKTEEYGAAMSVHGPSHSVIHVSSMNNTIETDSLPDTGATLTSNDSFLHIPLKKNQWSTDCFSSFDATQLSNVSLVHNSMATDDQDTSSFAFTSSKRSIIHLIRTNTHQLPGQKIPEEFNETTVSFLTDAIEEHADSCIFLGKLCEDEQFFGTKSCVITPRCISLNPQQNTRSAEKQNRTSVIKSDSIHDSSHMSETDIIAGLQSDDWQKQIDAITKCVEYFALTFTPSDRVELQTLINAYVAIFSSLRSKVVRHSIETLVPIFETRNPVLLQNADKIFGPLLLRVGAASQADFISTLGDQALKLIATLARPGKLIPILQREASNKSAGVRWRVAQLLKVILQETTETAQTTTFFRNYTEIYIELLLRLIGDSSESARKHAREAFKILWEATQIPGETTPDFLYRHKVYSSENLSKLKFLS